MTVWAHRFMVIPDAQKTVALELATKISSLRGSDATKMWSMGLNALGTGVPTHWISSGLIDADFAALMGDASTTFATYQAAGGTTVTLAQVQALYTAANIRSDLQGKEASGITALGLKLIAGTI